MDFDGKMWIFFYDILKIVVVIDGSDYFHGDDILPLSYFSHLLIDSHASVPLNDKMETEESVNVPVFQKEKDKMPPDQIENIFQIINKLSQQVQQLMKNPTEMRQ